MRLRLNYFSNYMLKYHPQELTQELLREQDRCLSLLKQGEKIYLWPGCSVAMRAGKLITEDEGRHE